MSDGILEGFEVVGQAKLNKLLKAGIEFCPQAVCQTRTVEIEGALILLFRVEYHPNRVVELSDGSVFLRIGDQNRRLGAEEIVPFPLEELVTGHYILEKLPHGSSRVLAVVVHRDVIEAHLSVLKAAGLFPEQIFLRSLHLQDSSYMREFVRVEALLLASEKFRGANA